jgi:hypothetical protein
MILRESSERTKRFFHGTHVELKSGDLILPGTLRVTGTRGSPETYVYLTPNPDEAIWDAELAAGDGQGRVYVVEPTGEIADAAGLTGRKPTRPLTMSYCSCRPLQVVGEVTEWVLYHGTRADLKLGDLIKPGHTPNFGNTAKPTTYVYMSRTVDAATWGAELAAGDGRGRIYIVEPTGPIEDDPNLTDKKFRGNPTKSFRSRQPLRVIGEITDWQGHSPEALDAMKGGLERMKRLGVEPID